MDNPILKIDAPTDALVAKINQPAPGYSLERVIDALKQFDGNFILQTMFLKAPGFRLVFAGSAGRLDGHRPPA